ncbi:hypothetical protein ACJ72_07384 [Emergomyces africanus]|uniref:Uncharacterized protein n=1 Tax=Emergomyces africanus TaxID=1955775 RepID=A0A1B7NNX8_9EURO|nr:hypothetical protein ACJ72_07384 [Emergomyces africanus]
MAYQQRGGPPRQYNDRPPPPPQNYGYQNRGRGGYGPGPRNPNYDDRGQYYDDRGGYAGGGGGGGGGGGQRGRGHYDQYAPPNRGRGGPPPDRYGPGERRPMNGPPPGPPSGPLPPNFDKSFPRPPPLQQRPRHPNDGPPLSPAHPGETSFDNPFPAFPTRRRGNSNEVDRRMGTLDLNDSSMRPPEQRPHTSNSNGPPRQRQQEAQPWGGPPGGRNMAPLPDIEPRMGPKRSATMPLNQDSTAPQYPGQQKWQEPPMPRPGAAGGSNPNRAPFPESGGDTMDNGSDLPDDFLDAYFGPSDPVESDMPNFNAMRDVRNDNIVPVDTSRGNGSSPPNTGNGYTAYRPGGPTSGNSMDLPANQFENAGFHFDLPPSPSATYDQGQLIDDYGPPSNDGYSQRHPTRGMAHGPAYHRGGGGGRGGYAHPRPPPKRYSPPGQGTHMQYPEGQPGYQNQPSLADSPSQHPDALPHHPVPFRPGLDKGAKPPPVRQYDNPPPMPPQNQLISGGPLPPTGHDRQAPAQLTHEELNRIQQTAKNNPSDHKAQLFLAQKLVEASVVLIDEGGRADIRTKNKNRERYILDAHKIVKKLVSSGYPPAMFYLADCYGEGQLGLEVDPKEAFSLYQSAAKGGHPESAYRLAVCCEMGYEGGGGTKRDPMKAVQWYRRAAALGDTPAMYKMGMILLKGLLGQQKNPREAVSWLKRAAERADENNPHALHELALLYENPNGNDAIIQDEAYSRELLEQAAELGYKFSQYRLGAAYEHGLLGCPVDPRLSIMWYTQAAAQGEHQGELSLAGWYLTGAEGILQQSDTEAYLWARKAAMAGLAKAEYAMGYFTEVGIGVPAIWKMPKGGTGKHHHKIS